MSLIKEDKDLSETQPGSALNTQCQAFVVIAKIRGY